MTRVLYDPAAPDMVFSGHAGAGTYGQDPVCAALSMLMFTLLEALPAEGVERHLADGYCRVRGGAGGPYAVIAAGLRRLEKDYPAYVKLEVKT